MADARTELTQAVNELRALADELMPHTAAPMRRAVIANEPDSYTTLRANFRRAVYGLVKTYLEDTGSRVTFYRNRLVDAIDNELRGAFYRGYLDVGGEETDREDEDWLASTLDAQREYAYNLFNVLKTLRGQGVDPDTEGETRAAAWAVTLDGVYSEGRLRGDGNQMLTFQGEDGDESCEDCQYYKGQRHSAKWWTKRGLVARNGNEQFACGRWAPCKHDYYTDAGEKWTR